MRRESESLAWITTDMFGLDVFDNVVFLSCGNRTDCYEDLYWDQDVFLLLTKRLESGHLQ